MALKWYGGVVVMVSHRRGQHRAIGASTSHTNEEEASVWHFRDVRGGGAA